jgi:simple sugar transport system ATP-binding protein
VIDRALAVEMTDITKSFPGVLANEDVNLSVAEGEIHAVIGENGAGKSTLMKILYGMQAPDEGSIKVHGSEVRFRSPKDAIDAEVGMVHQHFMLADNLTVLENIVLGAEPRTNIQLDFAQARSRIKELGQTYGLEVDPDTLVETLTVGARQRVEILKVLYRGAKILILDEPTAVLVPQEVDELFSNLKEIKEEGETVIFISHKLDEVLTVADTITVMRDGRTVAEVDPEDVDLKRLAELMVGSELPTAETTESTVTDVVELSVAGLSAENEHGRLVLTDLSFDVHQGEIVGIAGVEGNGQNELIDAIMGIHPITAGTISYGDSNIDDWSTKKRREAGIGIIPSDRHRQGLLLLSPLWENAMLGHQTREPFARGPWINRSGARERTVEIIDRFDIKTPGPDVLVAALSGGNQQKLVVGREMIASPTVLVAAHPTRGIDVGAQAAIWEELRDARAAGLGVLLVSADLDELIGLSDTLLVMYGGEIVAELDPKDITPEVLGGYMTGVGEAETS